MPQLPSYDYMLDIILRSGICLNPTLSHAVQLARMAGTLPPGFQTTSALPATVYTSVREAYALARASMEVRARQRANRS